MHLSGFTMHSDRFPTRDVYPFSLEVIQEMKSIEFRTPVTFLIGENGTGKSTLLKALCRRCGIHIWEETDRARTHYNSFEDELHTCIDIKWKDGPVHGSFFSSQIFHDFARYLDEWARADPAMLKYFGGDSLLTQSHGESLISFFASRYRVKGVYFMDEPETALSPKSQLKLLKILKKMSDIGHAQFIIASHSPILLAFPGASIWSFDTVPASPLQYEDTEYYRVYKDFLNNQSKYMASLDSEN